jgi:hypothetical protein
MIIKRIILSAFFWITFPMSFPLMLLTFFVFWLGDDDDYLDLSTLWDMIKHFYFGVRN